MDTCISNKIHVILYLPACQKICNTAENCSLCQTKPHNHLLYQPTKCQEAIYRLIALYDKVKPLVSREWIQETLYKTDKVACKYNYEMYEYTDFTLCHKLGTHDLNCITASSDVQCLLNI